MKCALATNFAVNLNRDQGSTRNIEREREREKERERGREGERGTSTAAETIMLDEIKSFSVLEDRETGVLSRSIW